MASPGQKKGSCRQVIAAFDSHKKCAHCHNKGLGHDLVFSRQSGSLTSEQKLQLSIPSYEARKEKKSATHTASFQKLAGKTRNRPLVSSSVRRNPKLLPHLMRLR